jgi:hypothetical protein
VHDFPGFGFAPDVPDTRRIAFWQNRFARDVANHTFPALEVLYLPEDHTTQGLSSTPQQQVADADKALGQLVDTVSHSPYWGSTAIFMSEDDPQSGLDHVNEHRTIGLVVSPWTKSGQRVTEHLDQTGMLKTIEELLGLPPLTEHDADARDFANLFTTSPDLRPFSTLTATVPVISAAARDRMNAAALAAIPAGTSLAGIAPQVQARLTAYDHAQAPPALTRSAGPANDRAQSAAAPSCG